MKALAGVLALIALSGCASGTRSSAPSPTGAEPSPPSAPAAAPVELHDVVAACDEVMDLSEGGDHKPAVDAMLDLGESASRCAPSVVAAFEASRETLRLADDLVRLGLEHRDRGEINAARANFDQALALYPDYYWVRALAEALPAETGNPEEGLALSRRAAELRSQDRLEDALDLLEQARALSPADPEIAESIARLETEIAFRHLAAANRAATAGKLGEAAESVARATAVAPEEERARQLVVEAARNLGLSLFSAGELVKARGLWQGALQLDRDNETLLQYLDEVEARLQSLEAIKEAGDGPSSP